ncbi:MAG TPA: FAD-dependent oxidoreductase [Chloroflexota bacterium]|jgi:glycerol-3-phosphate dehydrogenase
MEWRDSALQRLAERRWPLLVVGGGITGAGIALEAALRGVPCALVERSDFASGTSRRSTKLIHGGLRYLLLGATEFVAEALTERSFLLQHAPELVRPLPFLLPLQSTPEPPRQIEHMLTAYEHLGEPWPLPRHRLVSQAELQQRASIVKATQGAYEYHEAETDDAWLTLAVLHAAQARGAVACNWLELAALESAGSSKKVTLHDRATQQTIEIEADTIVLAVGAWLGMVVARLNVDTEDELCPAKGTHVVLEQPPEPLRSGLTLRHPGDGRFVTLTPWHDRLLLGSTDTECAIEELDCPMPTSTEVEYLLEAVHDMDWQPRVTAAWSGVRPLLGASGARTADLSREDRLLDLAPGMIAIAGGKLTTFRRLAQRVLDRICQTNADPFPMLTRPLQAADEVQQLAQPDAMVVTLDDALSQRLPLSLLDPEQASAKAEDYARALAPALGWDAQECDRQVMSYRAGLTRFHDPRRHAAVSASDASTPRGQER